MGNAELLLEKFSKKLIKYFHNNTLKVDYQFYSIKYFELQIKKYGSKNELGGKTYYYSEFERIFNKQLEELIDEQKKIVKELENDFKDLLICSEKENFYFGKCTINTYKNTYFSRLETYLKATIDSNELDFINNELQIINPERIFFKPIDITVKKSQKRKIEFLEARKKQLENNSNPQTEPISDPPQPENPFPKIFTVEGYRLFVKLQTSFISDDKRNVKVNYSYLYHYLNDDLHTNLLCTQDEYIGFINDNYHVSLSKIQPQTTKYDDKVKKKLDGIRKNLSI